MTAPFDGLRSPRPAPQLRVRVLAAAAAATPERPHWIDLLWESRRARLALALAFAFALAANLGASSHLRGTPRPVARTVEIEGMIILADRFEARPEPLPEEVR